MSVPAFDNPRPAFDKAAFVEQILAHSRRTPGFLPWHIGEIARPYYTIPDEMTDPHEWRKSFLHEATRALKSGQAKRFIASQQVYMGQLSPVEEPVFSSTLHGHMTDESAATIERCLAKREVYRPDDQKFKRIHFPINPRWAPGLGKRELLELFRANSFMDNRVLMQLTSIYLYLNELEPEVASTFRFSLYPQTQEDITEILKPHSEDLEHWKSGSPETSSTVHITRKGEELRLFYFGRPLDAKVIKNIYKKIDNLGQGVEFW